MREDANKGVYVEGLLEVEVQNVQDVLHLLLLVSPQHVFSLLDPTSGSLATEELGSLLLSQADNAELLSISVI